MQLEAVKVRRTRDAVGFVEQLDERASPAALRLLLEQPRARVPHCLGEGQQPGRRELLVLGVRRDDVLHWTERGEGLRQRAVEADWRVHPQRLVRKPHHDRLAAHVSALQPRQARVEWTLGQPDVVSDRGEDGALRVRPCDRQLARSRAAD